METLCELIVIRNLIDRLLASEPALAVQVELYSSRIFMVRAIREQNANSEVCNYEPQLGQLAEKGIEA